MQRVSFNLLLTFFPAFQRPCYRAVTMKLPCALLPCTLALAQNTKPTIILYMSKLNPHETVMLSIYIAAVQSFLILISSLHAPPRIMKAQPQSPEAQCPKGALHYRSRNSQNKLVPLDTAIFLLLHKYVHGTPKPLNPFRPSNRES